MSLISKKEVDLYRLDSMVRALRTVVASADLQEEFFQDWLRRTLATPWK
jgi:hypothetical protein